MRTQLAAMAGAEWQVGENLLTAHADMAAAELILEGPTRSDPERST